MPKTLKTIQGISKVAEILSKIVFIFCLVGAALCAAGIAATALGAAESFSIGRVDIFGIVKVDAELSVSAVYAALIAAAISCLGNAAVAKFSELYFKHELKAGTPFTLDGAKEMLTFGIIAIAVPLGCNVLNGIIQSVADLTAAGVTEAVSVSAPSVGMGVALIVVSFVLRYGAELAAGERENDENG